MPGTAANTATSRLGRRAGILVSPRPTSGTPAGTGSITHPALKLQKKRNKCNSGLLDRRRWLGKEQRLPSRGHLAPEAEARCHLSRGTAPLFRFFFSRAETKQAVLLLVHPHNPSPSAFLPQARLLPLGFPHPKPRVGLRSHPGDPGRAQHAAPGQQPSPPSPPWGRGCCTTPALLHFLRLCSFSLRKQRWGQTAGSLHFLQGKLLGSAAANSTAGWRTQHLLIPNYSQGATHPQPLLGWAGGSCTQGASAGLPAPCPAPAGQPRAS